MITGLSDDTDSALLANPKLAKGPTRDILERPDAPLARKTSRNEIISGLIAMLHGVEVLCYLPIMYLFKDDFKLGPATLIFALGLVRIPMNVKLLFAIISDGIPIFGSTRRSYLFIGALLTFTATLILGMFAHLSVWLTGGLLGLFSAGMAICSVIGEALIIETGHTKSNEQVTRTISAFSAFRKVTFAAMSYISSILVTRIPKQHIFLMASVLPLLVLLATPMVVESSRPPTNVTRQWRKLCAFASKPEIRRPTCFLFLSMLVPSAGTALFYFMTEALDFKPELFGRLAVIQAFASLIGIYVYATLLSQTSIRKLYIWSSILVALFCSLSIVLVKRYNVAIGIPDTAFVITDSSMLQFVGEINSLPIFIMATRLCPRGLESSMYSLLWTAQFLGLDMSSYISAALTYCFGIQANHFDGLVWLILLCSCCHLVPITLVSMLPESIPPQQSSEEEPCISDEDSQFN